MRFVLGAKNEQQSRIISICGQNVAPNRVHFDIEKIRGTLISMSYCQFDKSTLNTVSEIIVLQTKTKVLKLQYTQNQPLKEQFRCCLHSSIHPSSISVVRVHNQFSCMFHIYRLKICSILKHHEVHSLFW